MSELKHNFKELVIWKRGIELTVQTYALTGQFPESEKYGLTSQMRRAAVSVPSNIAEGAGRISDKYFRHFLSLALGSPNELETQLLVAEKLGFCSSNAELLAVQQSIASLGKMIRGLMNRLKSSQQELKEHAESYSTTEVHLLDMNWINEVDSDRSLPFSNGNPTNDFP